VNTCNKEGERLEEESWDNDDWAEFV